MGCTLLKSALRNTTLSNFQDVTISRTDVAVEYNIYRKPTVISYIIHNSSCHPPEHTTVDIRYLICRLTTCTHLETMQKCELQTVIHILQDSDYCNEQINAVQNKTINAKNAVNSEKNWAVFHILIEK